MIRAVGQRDAHRERGTTRWKRPRAMAVCTGRCARAPCELVPRARGPRYAGAANASARAHPSPSHSLLHRGAAVGAARAGAATRAGCPATGSARSPAGRPAGGAATPARNDGACGARPTRRPWPGTPLVPSRRSMIVDAAARPSDGRVGERHLVAPVDREERRHVERLVGCRRGRRRRGAGGSSAARRRCCAPRRRRDRARRRGRGTRTRVSGLNA